MPIDLGPGQITLARPGHTVTIPLENLHATHPLASIHPNWRLLGQGRILTLELSCPGEMEIKDFVLEVHIPAPQTFLANGYQTWTQTREFTAQDKIQPLLALGKPLLAPYGDYTFTKYSGRRGVFHSWSWAGFNRGESWLLLASVGEDNGFTHFEYDYKTETLTIQRDCQGTRVRRFPLLQLYIGEGREAEVWDEYAAQLTARPAPRRTGWTSWYNYYTKVSEKIVLENLASLAASGHPWDIIQIDDGWQGGIGDWLDVNEKFPSGLTFLARTIREKGYIPGLWLAPFICDRKSRLFKEHPDWLLKTPGGKPVKAGFNPGWSGNFYALDIYNHSFRNYLKKVFATVFNTWGFEMVKLDFLYAACIIPHFGKNRGQVMADALALLRELCGDKLILGCGVPLAQAAAGRTDYCRIGSDVAPYWEDRLLSTVAYRERVSTKNSLYSTLHRHMLDQRFFRNDPDVFILRDGQVKVNENKLTPDQRHTLFFLNNLLGGLVFLSDNIAEYTPEQKLQLAEMFPGPETQVDSLTCQGDLYAIHFQAGTRSYLALTNLSDTAATASLPPGQWFSPETGVVEGSLLHLRPHQTLCLVKVLAENSPYILGSSGHLYPGAQIQRFTPEGQGWSLDLSPHASPHTRVWIAVPSGCSQLTVNGTQFTVDKSGPIPHIIL